MCRKSHWQTITLVAGLRLDAMVAPMVVEGPITGEMFLAYVEQCLVPTRRHAPGGNRRQPHLGDQFLALKKGRKQPSDDGRHFGLVVDDKDAVRRAGGTGRRGAA